MRARFRHDSDNSQQHIDVKNALATAAERLNDTGMFMEEYAGVSHQNKLPLDTMFDLFVREPLATSTSIFHDRWFCNDVSAKTVI